MSSNSKYCKDCRYARRGLADYVLFLGGYRWAECRHPLSQLKRRSGKELVTGEKPKVEYSYCATMRDLDWLCGEGGQHFEPKQRLLRRRGERA